jgi:hypothetical protein
MGDKKVGRLYDDLAIYDWLAYLVLGLANSIMKD